MAIIEFHEGRPPDTVNFCWGPRTNFYTIFGTETWHLIPHLIFSILVGFVLFGVLFYLKKRGKIKLPLAWVIIIPIILIIVLFFLLAYFFPIRVVY